MSLGNTKNASGGMQQRFFLCVDDFGVKYVYNSGVDHLLKNLNFLYKISMKI